MNPARLREICAAFLKLGATSFGGPVAHLGYIRTECVEKRGWVDDDRYADLVALCQFLPGPASSQVAFALGLERAGIPGALTASVCFLLPSAAAMIAFAYGVEALGTLHDTGWIHGFKLAAVAVVAQAVWLMGQKLCPDRQRVTVCLSAAAVCLALPGAATQSVVLLAGALAGVWLFPSPKVAPLPPSSERPRVRRLPMVALAVFAALLVVLPFLAARHRGLDVFTVFYRAGALVFGGGHVVLPLLREAVVPRGWLGDDAFLAGYGAVQAVPGPLFSFAGYLGTAMHAGPHRWVGGLWCLLAIFLPSWLLVAGTLPFWHRLRDEQWAEAALRGANAAVVGVLLSALYTPVMTEAVHGAPDMAMALVAFGLLQAWKAPPWLVVFAVVAASSVIGRG